MYSLTDEEILDYALEKTKVQMPYTFDYKKPQGRGAATGEDKSSFADEFFDSLEKGLSMNGVFSEFVEPNNLTKSASASAYAAKVLTSVYMINKMQKNIDAFFADPANESKLEGLSEEQRKQRCEELKTEALNKMAPQAQTQSGSDLFWDIQNEFSEMAAKSQGKSLNEDEPDAIDSFENMFLTDGLAAIHAFNWEMCGSRNCEESMRRTKEAFKESGIAQRVLAEIEQNRDELDKETKHGLYVDNAMNNEEPDFLMPAPKIIIDNTLLKSRWERLFDSIKKLLGFGKEKTAEESVDSSRKKISYEELSGLNNVEQTVTRAKNRSNSLSMNQSDLSKPMSKGK